MVSGHSSSNRLRLLTGDEEHFPVNLPHTNKSLSQSQFSQDAQTKTVGIKTNLQKQPEYYTSPLLVKTEGDFISLINFH